MLGCSWRTYNGCLACACWLLHGCSWLAHDGRCGGCPPNYPVTKPQAMQAVCACRFVWGLPR